MSSEARGSTNSKARTGRRGDRTLVLGSGEFACRLIEELQRRSRVPYHIVGIIADYDVYPESICGYPVMGPVAALTRIIEEIRPTRIVVAVTERRSRLPVTHLLDCELQGISVEEGVELYEHLTGRVAIEFLTPSELLSSRKRRPAHLHAALGRVSSFLVGLIGLIVLSPLLAVIALAIKLDSRGPVFFVHHRVGLGNRPFPLIKFRSMHPASTTRSEWAGDNSDRVTRMGRLLRKFWLDELPELFNMLRGDMNLIGPRPHPVSNWVLFTMVLRNTPQCGQRIPYCSLRTTVRPGLTGWAQVRYRYANNLEEEVEKVKYDLYYVKYRTVWLDLRIVLYTIRLMFSGRGTAALETPVRSATAPLQTQGSLRAHG